VAQACLVALLLACLFVAARMLKLPGWIALIPGAPAFALQAPRVPSVVQRAVRAALMVALAGTCIVGFVHVLYPVLPPEPVRVALRGLTVALCILTTILMFGTRAFSHGRVLLPAATGLLLAAALSVSGESGHFEMPYLTPLPLLALVAYLVSNTSTLAPHGARGLVSRRMLRLALSLAVTLAAAMVATRLLPWAAPLIERLFGDSGTQGVSGFGSESRLGEIEKLALDDSVALRVWTDEPHYLRLRVTTRFGSNSWYTEPSVADHRRMLPMTAREPPAFAASVADVPGTTVASALNTSMPPRFACARVLPAQPLGTNALPTSSGLLLLRTASERIEQDSAGIAFAPVGGVLDMFGFATWPAAQEPGIAERPEVLSSALAVPTTLDRRMRELAEQLATSATTPVARVRATVGYLQSHCHYALDVGRFQSRDAVAEFVFDKRRGYCEYFASAAALLLRLEGVPTRYVTGFAVGSTSFVAGHYVVRMSDAHAWIEAYVDGAWQEIEPTPPDEYEALHQRRSRWWSVAWESLRGAWMWLTTAVGQCVRAGDFRWLGRQLVAALRYVFDHPLAGAALLLFFVAPRLPVRRWLDRLRRRRMAPPPRLDGAHAELRAVFARMERLIERRGAPRPSSRPPLEHVRALPTDIVEPELRLLAEDIVHALYATLFEGSAPAPTIVEDLRQRLGAVEARRPPPHTVR
jgi:transglutaminase-like putative cysteine protease